MKATVKKITDETILKKACEMTMKGTKSHITTDKIYCCEHSPIRTQLFWIELYEIPTFVSVHLVRHKVGVEHYVMSNRDDRGGEVNVSRSSPINHAILVNAQSLINIFRKRLCNKSHKETIELMHLIKDQVELVDPVLVKYLVPECEYRGGLCHENKSCGRYPTAKSLTQIKTASEKGADNGK